MALIKDIIRKGELGEIYTWKVRLLADDASDADSPMSWFYKKEISGGGANYDLNVHLVDLAHFLIGSIDSVVSIKKTFVEERKSPKGKKEKVDTEDYMACLANFNNNAAGIFDASRISTGDRSDTGFEIRGSKGAAKWDYQSFNFIELYKAGYDKINGFRKVYTTESDFPYMKGYYGMAGHGQHYESLIVHQIYDLLTSIGKDEMPSPNLRDGLEAQRVLEAIDISHEQNRWVKIGEVS